jgi:hypothetical protein
VSLLPLQWVMVCFNRFYKSSPLQAHWGRCCCSCLLVLACLFTDYVKECLSLTLLWSLLCFSCFYKPSFPSPSTLGGEVLPLLPSPAGLFIHSSSGECLSPTLWSSGHPAFFAVFSFFFSYFFIIQIFFLLFPWVWVSLSRELC